MDQFNRHPLYRVHTIESIMSSLWDFYKKEFVVLFISSFVLSLALQYLSMAFNFNELQTITDPKEMLEKIKGFMLPIVAISLVSLLCTTILHYYVIYNPVDNSNTIFVSFYKSLKYFIPYLIIMVLLAFFGSIAMLLGLLVFIVGVFFALLYVLTIYLLILPILMVEGTSIGNAIVRAFTLTHRGFWSNIGWVAIFIIIIMVISVVLAGLILLPFSGGFLKILSNPSEASNVVDFMSNPFYLILAALSNALYLPLLPIFATILYFNGKAREEVADSPSVANEPGKTRVEDLYSKPYSEDNPEGSENKH